MWENKGDKDREGRGRKADLCDVRRSKLNNTTVSLGAGRPEKSAPLAVIIQIEWR